MKVGELVKILQTLDPECEVFALSPDDEKVEPSIHIDNYLNAEKQEVIVY